MYSKIWNLKAYVKVPFNQNNYLNYFFISNKNTLKEFVYLLNIFCFILFLIEGLPYIIIEILTMTGILSFLFYMSWELMLWVLIPTPILSIGGN